MKTILIVDDDVYIGNALEEILIQEGYSVSRAYSGTEAVLLLSRTKPDLVLLDLMLPGLNGENVLAYMKGLPVIVVSAKADIDSKVSLLLGGAVDYVTKPFHTKELLARIEVHLRSQGAAQPFAKMEFSDITLYPDTHLVLVQGKEVSLTKTEYAILKLLMENKTRILSKSVLLDRVSADTPDCTETSLRTHISHLRAKLSQITGKSYIETIWGIGFRMREEISTQSQQFS